MMKSILSFYVRFVSLVILLCLDFDAASDRVGDERAAEILKTANLRCKTCHHPSGFFTDLAHH